MRVSTREAFPRLLVSFIDKKDMKVQLEQVRGNFVQSTSIITKAGVTMEGISNVEHVRRTRVRTDRILPETRWLSAIIIPFLLAAFGVLYLLPEHTGELFAWNIQPRMTAMMLGEAYLAGAYFFVRAVLSPRWHWVAVGFLPVTTFATLMGITTILHWDRFNHGSVAFWTWVVLYFTTPSLFQQYGGAIGRRTQAHWTPGTCWCQHGCAGSSAPWAWGRFSSASSSSCYPTL